MPHRPRTILALCLSAAACASAPAAGDGDHIYVTAAELHGSGDFDGDGAADVVVVERSSGVFSIGYHAGGGELVWDRPRPSGIAGADALAVGELRADEVGFAVSAGAANRVHVVFPGAAGEVVSPLAVFPTGLQPTSLAALPVDFGSGAETLSLAVEGGWRADPRRNVIEHPGDEPAERVDLPGQLGVERGARVRFGPRREAGYAALSRGAAGDVFYLRDGVDPELVLRGSLEGLAPGTEFVHGAFDDGVDFAFYVAGGGSLTLVGADDDGAIVRAEEHEVGGVIERVGVVRRGERDALMVAFADGLVTAFDVVGSRLVAAGDLGVAGEHVAGVLGYGDGRVVLLTAAGPGMRSSGFRTFEHIDGRWRERGGGDLPATGAVVATSNVILYDRDPVLDEGAVVVKVLHVPDWTTDVQFGGGSGLTVFAEHFRGESDGLGGGAVFSLGPAPAGATHGLPNQLRGDASVIGAEASAGVAVPAISADPPGGVYDETIAVRLLTKDPTATAYFALEGAGGGAQPLAPGDAIAPPAGTLEDFTLIYFAVAPDGRRSPLHRASYRFAGAPGEVDSDSDGVPDFVESDPHGGRDTDGDGASDLEELVAGTDPDDPGDAPAPSERPDFHSVFDVAVQPLSVAGDGSFSAAFAEPARATAIGVRSPSGSLLGAAATRAHGLPGLADPVALIEAVPASGGGFVVVATPKTFDVRATPEPSDGRESVGLVPVPHVSAAVAVDYSYSGGTPAAERAAWLAAVRAQFADGTRPQLVTGLTYRDSLALQVMERFLAREIARRDPVAAAASAELSLTGFRDRGTPAMRVDDALLSGLERPGPEGQPAFVLHQVFDALTAAIAAPPTPKVAALVDLAHDIYRTSARLGGERRGEFPNPFDTLRSAVRSDDLSTPEHEPIELPGGASSPARSYAKETSLTQEQLDAAAGGVADLLALVQARVTVDLQLVVVSDSYRPDREPLFEEVGSPRRFRLFDSERRPFQLPSTFTLPVGTRLAVSGFTDGEFPPGGGDGIEVVSATVLAIGLGGARDSDGDLLDDGFAAEHFGATPVDAFADHDGDGFSTLQESLEGSDPTDAGDRPQAPAEDLRPPEIDLQFVAGGTLLTFDFPSRYDHRIGFRMEASDRLRSFADSGLRARRAGGGAGMELFIPRRDPSPRRQFHRVAMFLR